jgi:hypothetical protein
MLSAQVVQSTTGKSGFELSLALGKNSGARRKFESGFFDPPKRVVIIATVGGVPSVLMDGVITRHEISTSNEPGQSRLNISGEDLSRLMDIINFNWVFKYPAMPAEARVLIILAKYAALGIVPVVVPSVNLDIPIPTSRIPSHMGTDLQYVTYLANSVGYVFYVDPDPLPGIPVPRQIPPLATGVARSLATSGPGGAQPGLALAAQAAAWFVPGRSVAYWGPEVKTGQPQAALVVNSDAASNVDRLSFSFDGFSKTVHVILIRPEELPLPIPIPIPDVNPLSPPLGRRSPIPLRVEPLQGVSHYNPAQAIMIGLAKAARSAEVITGSGSLDVLRYGRLLKPRRLVEVRGAGLPHDGLHFVRSVTHQIKAGEYKQSFTLSRNAFEPLSLRDAYVGMAAAAGAGAAAQRLPAGPNPFA